MVIKEVQIKECMHFRGFRYGGFGNNIYEDYINGLATNIDIHLLKQQFINRVLAYEGTDFGACLGIKLSKKYKPWLFPWSFRISGSHIKPLTPENNPDIICHISSDGVLASHINREFNWLVNSFNSIKSIGYQPQIHGYVSLMKLSNNHKVRYLVLDGNHRLSAMHAMGEKTVIAKVYSNPLFNSALAALWPGVLLGRFTKKDSQKIHHRYFYDENLILPEAAKQKLIQDEPWS